MNEPEFIDESIKHELRKSEVRFTDLKPGQQLNIVLGEGDDCSQQAKLRLELISLPDNESMARFKIITADLDDDILRKNQESGMREPEMMGGELLVDFSATYRPGYMPLFTLAEKDTLSEGRHMFGWIPYPTEANPEGGLQYHAEVLALEVLD